MYIGILLFPLCLTTIATVASEVVPSRQVTNQNKSVVLKCGSYLERQNLTSTVQFQLLLLNIVCYTNIDKYFDCILQEIYKSDSLLDIHIRSTVDYSKVKAATHSLCREALKLNDEVPNCNVSEKCHGILKSSEMRNHDSPIFCELIENKRCVFDEFAKCDLQRTMLWAKYQKESQSIGCLLADPKFQLVPSYGPEMKCYSSINIDDINSTDYSQIYERYCEQFNYTDVSSCIEKSLSNVTSEELWEDKESYLNKARKFVNDRRSLCRDMTSLSSLKCSIPTHKPDVSICQRMLFLPPGPANYRTSYYVQFYGYCVWLNYLPCNFTFGYIIFRNLITYEEK